MTIDVNALTNLGSSLEELNVESNNLTRLESNTFQSLFKLRKLHLNSNKIQHLARHAFLGLVCLEELNLQDNKLLKIESGTFEPLAQLKQLRLFINQIRSVEVGTFRGLVTLEELYIGKNKVKFIFLFSNAVSPNIAYFILKLVYYLY
jgi:Leucine-rich repeat (LRR) protein